jgi:hypothetical protein
MKRIILGTVAVVCLVGVGYAAGAKMERADRFFEMRTYYANPGKISSLHARFRDHTVKLFEKHGMQNIGYWQQASGEEARKKSWDAFTNDPDWKKAKADSEKDGVLVAKVESKFMKPADYSAIK